MPTRLSSLQVEAPECDVAPPERPKVTVDFATALASDQYNDCLKENLENTRNLLQFPAGPRNGNGTSAISRTGVFSLSGHPASAADPDLKSRWILALPLLVAMILFLILYGMGNIFLPSDFPGYM